jgi:hypothetical protein
VHAARFVDEVAREFLSSFQPFTRPTLRKLGPHAASRAGLACPLSKGQPQVNLRLGRPLQPDKEADYWPGGPVEVGLARHLDVLEAEVRYQTVHHLLQESHHHQLLNAGNAS